MFCQEDNRNTSSPILNKNDNMKSHFHLDMQNFKYSNTPRYAPPSYANPTDTPLWIAAKIPDTLILVIYPPPAMLFFSFFKKIPDIILVIYLPPTMLFLISQKIPDMLILVLYLPLKAKLFKKRVTWPAHWPISDELLCLQIQNNSSRSNLFDDVTR